MNSCGNSGQKLNMHLPSHFVSSAPLTFYLSVSSSSLIVITYLTYMFSLCLFTPGLYLSFSIRIIIILYLLLLLCPIQANTWPNALPVSQAVFPFSSIISYPSWRCNIVVHHNTFIFFMHRPLSYSHSKLFYLFCTYQKLDFWLVLTSC